MQFTFDPSQINDGGLNQMRHELGDVFVHEPDKETYLCDEEILAALSGSSTFKRAKYRLVESLLRRFSYEVDTKVDKVEWKLSQRVDEWKSLFTRLKSELEPEEAVSSNFGFSSHATVAPFFTRNMFDY